MSAQTRSCEERAREQAQRAMALIRANHANAEFCLGYAWAALADIAGEHAATPPWRAQSSDHGPWCGNCGQMNWGPMVCCDRMDDLPDVSAEQAAIIRERRAAAGKSA